jgi:hypothetical protein
MKESSRIDSSIKTAKGFRTQNAKEKLLQEIYNKGRLLVCYIADTIIRYLLDEKLKLIIDTRLRIALLFHQKK